MPDPPDPLVRPSAWKVLGFKAPPDPAELAAAAQRTGQPATPAPQDEDWMSRTARMVGGGVLQLGDLVRGLTIGTDDPNDTWAAKGGTLAAAGLPVIEGLKGAAIGLPALGRFFSRVDRVAEAIPKKGIHPNKLKSLLQSGASQEEVAYRKVDQLLANKGNALVTPEELRAHLEAHPAPVPEVTKLGEPAPMSFEEWLEHPGLETIRHERAMTEDPARAAQLDDALRKAYETSAKLRKAPQPTKYHSYTLPGGEDYREHLLQLPSYDPRLAHREQVFADYANKTAALDARIDAHVQSGYSLLSREEIAALTAERQALGEAHDAAVAQFQRAGPIHESQPFRSGHFDQPNILAHARTKERALPTGERGRFIEEIQSDWHQQGKRQGYQGAPDPADAERLAQLRDEIEQGQRTVADVNHELRQVTNVLNAERLPRLTRPHLPPEYAHLTSFGNALNQGPEATAAWRAAREQAWHTPEYQQARAAEQAVEQRLQDAVSHVSALQEEQTALHTKSTKGVPDAPFKETWPDLALKQQLLDTAHHPDLSWLGFTSGKTQAERYDLSKQISRLTFEPEEAGDFSLGSLVAHDLEGNEVLRENRLEPHQLDEYVGKEPADKLRGEIAGKAHDAEQWSVTQDPEDGYWYVVDPNGEYVGGDHALTEQGAERALYNLRSQEHMLGDHPNISGLDLQVGGEGMRSFYDQLLPKRLQKILKPFGGTVERANINTLPTGAIPQGNPSLEETSAWIARLTPEMKQRILREGLPLLAIPAAAGLAYGQPGYQGDPNAPPVQPPSPPPGRR